MGHTLRSINNLACLLNDQGRLADSEFLHRESLAGCLQIFGIQHPETLTCMETIASLLHAQGRRSQAKRVMRLVQDNRRASLGGGHPDTVRATSLLANLLDLEGRPDKAKTVRRGRDLENRGFDSGTGTHEAAGCANCCATERSDDGIKFSRCQQCQVARYCSRDCQKMHWKSQHKH